MILAFALLIVRFATTAKDEDESRVRTFLRAAWNFPRCLNNLRKMMYARVRIVQGFSSVVVLLFAGVRLSVRPRRSDVKLHVCTRGILAQIVNLRAHCPARPPVALRQLRRVALRCGRWSYRNAQSFFEPRTAHTAHTWQTYAAPITEDDCSFFSWLVARGASSKCVRISLLYRGVSSSARASRLEGVRADREVARETSDRFPQVSSKLIIAV